MTHKILYDAECPMCVKFADTLRRLDRSAYFELVSLQIHFAEDDTIPLHILEADLHVIKSDGSLVKGDEAYDFICSTIPAAKTLRSMLGETTTRGIFSGVKRMKRWTKSRFAIKKFCFRCNR